MDSDHRPKTRDSTNRGAERLRTATKFPRIWFYLALGISGGAILTLTTDRRVSGLAEDGFASVIRWLNSSRDFPALGRRAGFFAEGANTPSTTGQEETLRTAVVIRAAQSTSVPLNASSGQGDIGLLTALEYSELLAAPGSGTAFSLLYHSQRTGEYVVSLPPRSASRRWSFLSAAFTEGRIVPNFPVTLQSLAEGASGFASSKASMPRVLVRPDERDPRENLQWYSADWVNSGGGPFPLALDQKFPQLQLEREGEVVFWWPRGLASSAAPFGLTRDQWRSQVGQGCRSHNPLTSRTEWIQKWFLDRTEKTSQESSSSVTARSPEDALESLDSALILHDSLPDESHPELAGLIVSAADLGLSRHRGRVGRHGTHGAGVVAALRNQLGGSGVAPGTKVLAFGLDPSLEGSDTKGRTSSLTLKDVLPGLVEIKRYLEARAAHQTDKGKTQLASAAHADETTKSTHPSERGARTQKKTSVRVLLLGYAGLVSHLDHGRALQLILEDLLMEHELLIVVPSGNRVSGQLLSASYFVPADAALRLNRESARGFLLPVAASDVCSRSAWFSNHAEALPGKSFFAPGQRIYSTLPESDYGFLTGTSPAASIAAGMALAFAQGMQSQAVKPLMKSETDPGLSSPEVRISAAQALARVLLSSSSRIKESAPAGPGPQALMLDSLKLLQVLEEKGSNPSLEAEDGASELQSAQRLFLRMQ